MLQPLLCRLAKSRVARTLAQHIPLARTLAGRFFAGETLPDAIYTSYATNQNGAVATLDYLGKSVRDKVEARLAADAYVDAFAAIERGGVDANVSIKLSQMGLDIDDDFCYKNVVRVVEKAAACRNFVRIDMEGSAYTERTLHLYRRLRQDYDNVGIVIQAYLHRSEEDVSQLIDEGIAHVRVCKGAYNEKPSLAFPNMVDVDTNYLKLLMKLFSPEAQERGAHVAIATHDGQIIKWARAYTHHHHIARGAFEFQMFRGVRPDLLSQLTESGYKTRVYIPYGTEWYPYFMLRLAERPNNLRFLLSR